MEETKKKKKIIFISNPKNATPKNSKLVLNASDSMNMVRNAKLNEGISAYIGISSPETPKYLLANNFLSEYFLPSYNVTTQYNFDWFTGQQVLHTEDEINCDKLKNSFDIFLKKYLGEDAIKQENLRLAENKHYYFPFTPEMLTIGNHTLRHILIYLQNLDDSFDYVDMRSKLENYIFHDMSGINHIIKILLQNPEGNIKYSENVSERSINSFWSILSYAELGRMKKLGRNLNEDLNIMLTHEYFCKLDFYRKYNYLSILLTSYVIQYIVCRRDANMGMLCKGAPSDSRLDGVIHRACCNNYSEIRNLFPGLLQQYYKEVVERHISQNETVRCSAVEGEVRIEGIPFGQFSVDVLGSRSKNQDLEYDKLIQAFGLKEGGDNYISVDDFIVRYINLKKSMRGSVLTKISSILPTSGRQIDMIFPKNNAKQKYFAMSANLTEFYVRLYLAKKKRQYDYLDNFIEFLQNRYRIVLTKNGEKMLKSIKPKLSAQEFSRNKAAFIDTLNGINCLIKLSDSGFVVTLPEEKGALKLI